MDWFIFIKSAERFKYMHRIDRKHSYNTETAEVYDTVILNSLIHCPQAEGSPLGGAAF